MPRYKKNLDEAQGLPKKLRNKIAQSWVENVREELYAIKDRETNYGTTQRENGEVVEGSVRDLVDTGELVTSVGMSTFEDKVSISMAGHGLYIHEGWITKSGRYIKGTPFTETAARKAIEEVSE